MQRSLTDGAVSSTGILNMASPILGGVLFGVDGTNAGTLKIHKGPDAKSPVIFHLSAIKVPVFITCEIQAAPQIYYNVSGTGATVQIYEYVP